MEFSVHGELLLEKVPIEPELTVRESLALDQGSSFDEARMHAHR